VSKRLQDEAIHTRHIIPYPPRGAEETKGRTEKGERTGTSGEIIPQGRDRGREEGREGGREGSQR